MFRHTTETEEIPDISRYLHGDQEDVPDKALGYQIDLSSMQIDDDLRAGVFTLLARREQDVAQHLIAHYTEMGKNEDDYPVEEQSDEESEEDEESR